MIKHSSYSVSFGQEPKVGLSSITLHPSIFSSITTQEELRDELDLLAVDLNAINEVASDHEVEEFFHDDNRKSNHEDHDQRLEKDDIEHVINLLNDRFERMHSLRQVTREAQKRPAEAFLQTTLKKQKSASWFIDDNIVSILMLIFVHLFHLETCPFS